MARIRQLNEPNLKPGFARRMRASLPEALDKINAELAVAFAESGKIEIARLHIRLMRETHQGQDNVEKIAELVLSPARNRIKEQIQRAKQSAQQNPAAADEAARILIEHAHPLLEVFDLFFGEQEHFQKELFDEVATTAVNCLVAYQRKTGDNEMFVKLLERALPLAESIEVRRRIEENIGIGKGNLRGKELRFRLRLCSNPFRTAKKVHLSGWRGSNAMSLLPLVRPQVFPASRKIMATFQRHRRTSKSFLIVPQSSCVASRLDAWNNHQDRQTAVAANELAIKHATSPELKQRLGRGQKNLATNALRGRPCPHRLSPLPQHI